MALDIVLALVALASSAFLIFQNKARPYAIAAAVVSALEVAIAFGWVQLAIAGVELGLVSGIVLAVVGVLLLMRLQKKLLVCAATLVAVAGAISALTALGVVH